MGVEDAWVTTQRADVESMCAARPFTEYENGLNGYSSGQLGIGVHPNQAGHTSQHDRAKIVIGY